MRYNRSRVNKFALRKVNFSLLAILFCYVSPFGGQLDLQYNHVGLPFAVFYNPSLIYDNSGVSFGVDTRYAGKNNHDVRAALTIPVVNSVNVGSAFSVGMLYDSYDNYQISTGFGTYFKYFKLGASFDIISREKIDSGNDEKLGLCVNLALAADIMERRTVSFVFHNVLVDERNERNVHGLTLGFGGILNPNLLLNTRVTGYIDKGAARRTEGGASLNFYIPQFILKNNIDYSMNASTGFDIIHYYQGRKTNNKFFMNIGVALFKKPTLAAALIGVDKNSSYIAFLYNSNNAEYNENIYSNLKLTESDNGQQFFHLEYGSGKIESWVLSLEEGSGRIVRTFSGGNVIPSVIEWDGLNYKGDIVKDQAIRARLVIQDKRKNVRESETIVIKR